MLVRLFTADDGQSHFEDLDMDAWPTQWDLNLSNARIDFARRGSRAIRSFQIGILSHGVNTSSC